MARCLFARNCHLLGGLRLRATSGRNFVWALSSTLSHLHGCLRGPNHRGCSSRSRPDSRAIHSLSSCDLSDLLRDLGRLAAHPRCPQPELILTVLDDVEQEDVIKVAHEIIE